MPSTSLAMGEMNQVTNQPVNKVRGNNRLFWKGKVILICWVAQQGAEHITMPMAI